MSISYIRPTTYGEIRWFAAKRRFNTERIRGFNQNKILCDELVSFDCVLFNLQEISDIVSGLPSGTEQIMAVIIRPGKTPDESLSHQGFVFCGYDLVEEWSGISAITNCGGDFQSIRYDNLTEYGLIPSFKEAVLTQLALVQEDPLDPHADCEIFEIWRKTV